MRGQIYQHINIENGSESLIISNVFDSDVLRLILGFGVGQYLSADAHLDVCSCTCSERIRYVAPCAFHIWYSIPNVFFTMLTLFDWMPNSHRYFSLICGSEPICIIKVDRDVCACVHDMLTPLLQQSGRYNLGFISNEILYIFVDYFA